MGNFGHTADLIDVKDIGGVPGCDLDEADFFTRRQLHVEPEEWADLGVFDQFCDISFAEWDVGGDNDGVWVDRKQWQRSVGGHGGGDGRDWRDDGSTQLIIRRHGDAQTNASY